MNRGSLPMHTRTMSRNLGFNEAPIHESGKFNRPRTALVVRAGFNEAPIHESGK